jgi:hypothetical protein
MVPVKLDTGSPVEAASLLLSRVERRAGSGEPVQLATIIGWYDKQWVISHPDLRGSPVGRVLQVGSLVLGRNFYRPSTGFLTFICSGEPTKAFRSGAELEKYVGSICYLKPRPTIDPKMGIIKRVLLDRWFVVDFGAECLTGVYEPGCFIKVERPDSLARLPDTRQIQLTLF